VDIEDSINSKDNKTINEITNKLIKVSDYVNVIRHAGRGAPIKFDGSKSRVTSIHPKTGFVTVDILDTDTFGKEYVKTSNTYTSSKNLVRCNIDKL
jgi:hypothetical protein